MISKLAKNEFNSVKKSEEKEMMKYILNEDINEKEITNQQNKNEGIKKDKYDNKKLPKSGNKYIEKYRNKLQKQKINKNIDELINKYVKK